MRAIGRDEVQLYSPPRLSEPFPHDFRVRIACVVEKDMDEDQHRIERLDRFQKPDRRGVVDGFDLDHSGLTVSRSTAPWMLMRWRPLVCSIARFSWLGAQQPAGRAAWGGWTPAASSTAPPGRAAWVGCTASANSTASSSGSEFKTFSKFAMKAFCFTSSSLRGMTFGL